MAFSNPTQKNSDLEQFYKLNGANSPDINIPDFSSELLMSLMSTDAQKNDLYASENGKRSLLSWRRFQNFRIVEDMVPNLQNMDHNNLIYKISIDCEKKVSALLMLCEREIGNNTRNINPILQAIEIEMGLQEMLRYSPNSETTLKMCTLMKIFRKKFQLPVTDSNNEANGGTSEPV